MSTKFKPNTKIDKSRAANISMTLAPETEGFYPAVKTGHQHSDNDLLLEFGSVCSNPGRESICPQKLNINFCSFQELLLVPHVNRKTANEILRIRQTTFIDENLLYVINYKVSPSYFTFSVEGASANRKVKSNRHLTLEEVGKRVDNLCLGVDGREELSKLPKSTDVDMAAGINLSKQGPTDSKIMQKQTLAGMCPSVSYIWDGSRHIPVKLSTNTVAKLLGKEKDLSRIRTALPLDVNCQNEAEPLPDSAYGEVNTCQYSGRSGVPDVFREQSHSFPRPNVHATYVHRDVGKREQNGLSYVPSAVAPKYFTGYGDEYEEAPDTSFAYTDDWSGSDSRGSNERYGYTHCGQGTRQQEDTELSIPDFLTYDGTGKWRSFFTKFTMYADEAEWTSEQRKRRLCWLLEGRASDFYALLVEMSPNIKFEELVKRFAQRFDFQDITEILILEFQMAKQRSDESLPEWGQRAEDMAYEAFRHMSDAHRYKMAVKRFCQGCRDKDAAAYAANKKPRTIEKAIDLVRNYQHNRKIIYGKSYADL